MEHPRPTAGFTLIELMTVVSVLAVLLALAAPNMADFIEKRRVVAAAEAIYAKLQLARSEAIKQSATVSASLVVNETGWYVGLSHDPDACSDGIADCTLSVGTDDVRQTVSIDDFPGVTMEASGSEPVIFTSRGIPSVRSPSTIDLTSNQRGWTLRVEVGPIGRISICAPESNRKPGAYPECEES